MVVLYTPKDRIKLIEPVVGREELNRVWKVLESGWLTEGAVTEEFEKKLASYVGAKHGIATCNCTLAIELALRALGIGRGCEVIVPDFTHPGTIDAIISAGAEPVLVDVNLDSYNIDVERLEEAITEKTKCIVPISWGGNPLNMKQIYKLKRKYGLCVVEDAACSVGAEYDGQKTGAMADASCFSFHPRKVITTGEGGMITTNDDKVADVASSLKDFGEGKVGERIEFVRYGTNYSMSDVLAAIGLAQLEKVDLIIAKRIELAKNYDELLSKVKDIKPPVKDEKAKHVYQTYAVYVENGMRDSLIKSLREINIETQIGTYALHLQSVFKDIRRGNKLENSVKLYKNLLTLPMCHSMTFDVQEYVVSQITRLMKAR